MDIKTKKIGIRTHNLVIDNLDSGGKSSIRMFSFALGQFLSRKEYRRRRRQFSSTILLNRTPPLPRFRRASPWKAVRARVTPHSPLHAAALALHCLLLSEGFVCTGQDDKAGTVKGFAPPVRDVLEDRLVPDRW